MPVFAASTLFAQMPLQSHQSHPNTDFVELTSLDSSIKLDIRYAQSNNFVGYPVYPQARAFLQRPAAEALLRVHKKLQKHGLGLLIFDGYRPWHITKLFWESVSKDQRKFVANPQTGSKHNRGCAVDLSMYDLQTGISVAMPSDYDEFTKRASPRYQGGRKQERTNRDMLQAMMKSEGFTVNPNEWWHFDYKNWQKYPVYDLSFTQIDEQNQRFPIVEIVERNDLKQFFIAAGVSGGIYIYDVRTHKLTVYDRDRMYREFAPASTSKIIHSLIFLDSGALKSEHEVIPWDGVQRRIPAWNQDHNLRSALQASAVWFYVEASKRVGQAEMQRYYDASDYGNRSTAGFGDAYWVKGDLRITPKQQLEFLFRLYKNDLPFSPQSLATVKDLLIQEQTAKYTLRAKTGWSDAYKPQVGWWIGYVERGQNVYFFVTEIDILKNEDAGKRMELSKAVLKKLEIIE